MPRAMIITVGTGRDRQDIAKAICFSITHNNPDFVLFFVTEKSKAETLPFILQDKNMEGKKHSEHITADENDFEKIQKEYADIIEKCGYSPENITIDYTSGTKSMSAGLIFAGIKMKVNAINYIAGTRDNEGRVIHGTERCITFEPNTLYADLLFEQSIKLFNKFQFESCMDIIKQTKNLITDFDFQKKISVLEKLSTAYNLWDKFNLKKAFLELNSISETDLLSKWQIKKQVEYNKQLLYKEKENLFCIEKIADLLENAARRGDVEKKYDDAVARLYRILEYVAQFKINELGYYKSDRGELSIDLEKLSENMREKYKDKLPLAKSYEFLSDLNDPLGKTFIQRFNEKEGKIKKLLGLRNNSILAHGFNPIDENTYKEIKDFVGNLVLEHYKDLESLVVKAKFPQIK